MQEIIVYRNPVEAAFWHGVMDGSFFPVIVGIIVFFAVFLGLNAAIGKLYGFWRAQKLTYLNMAIGALVAFAVMYRMYSVL